MLTLFTGAPGAGKTAALVDLLSSLPPGRPIYVDGLEGLTLPHESIDAHRWHTDLPDGAIMVIDEVQRVWRPRGPGQKVPDDVAALETHRHRGIDIYMTTQAPQLLDTNVRRLIGRHVHIRDTGITGRWWYEWPECNDSLSWKSCTNKHRYKLPKHIFDKYKSASLHTKSPRKIPLMVYVGALTAIALVVVSIMVYRILHRNDPVKVLSNPQAVTGLSNASSISPPGRGARPIDDRIDWIPRTSNKPESAPAYEHLRVVVAMPRVTGGFCINESCHCHTQQGTDSGLSNDECLRWVKNRPFDPYLPDRVHSQGSQPSSGSSDSAVASSGFPSQSVSR